MICQTLTARETVGLLSNDPRGAACNRVTLIRRRLSGVPKGGCETQGGTLHTEKEYNSVHAASLRLTMSIAFPGCQWQENSPVDGF